MSDSEMNEEPALLPAFPERQPSSMLAIIERLAINPAFDVAKFEALIGLQRAIEREARADAAETAFARAMMAAQQEIQPVARTTENTSTRSFYARLEDIDRAIRPIYLRHGFSLSYDAAPAEKEGNIRIRCRCRHIGGHFEDYYREAPPDTTGPKGSQTKTMLHGEASTETFLKRYLACGIFNVVFAGIDLDGNASSEPITEEQYQTLASLLGPAGVSVEQFCARWKIDSVSELPQKHFTEAVNGLKARSKRRNAEV